MNLRTENPKKTLDYLLQNINIEDVEKFKKIALQTYDHHSDTKSKRNETTMMQDLENKWYESLEQKNPAYHLYSIPEMLIEVWCCFHLYSKKYLSLIDKIDLPKNNIKTVVDLGCGIGFSTSILAEIFNDANIYGTQVKGSQYDIATKLGLEKKFNVIENIDNINKIDFVFASEYFEHFERPIEHLKTILAKDPDILVIANSFGSRSFGHFNEYKYDETIISNKKIGLSFNKVLRNNGYELMKTKFWNNRPAIWMKK